MSGILDPEYASNFSNLSILTEDEMITTERVGLVVHRLTRGEIASTTEIAAWTGLTRAGAWLMLVKLSRVIPIICIEGKWRCHV